MTREAIYNIIDLYRKQIIFAGMAQLVEQLNRNQQVGGSSPSSSTRMKVTRIFK